MTWWPWDIEEDGSWGEGSALLSSTPTFFDVPYVTTHVFMTATRQEHYIFLSLLSQYVIIIKIMTLFSFHKSRPARSVKHPFPFGIAKDEDSRDRLCCHYGHTCHG